MNFTISNNFKKYKGKIINIINNFKNEGLLIGDSRRNIIKSVIVNDKLFNFKSFKKPNAINRIVYQYFRKSKARRSFEYANFLLSKNFKTPQPIAYIEDYNFFGLTSSYYVCEHLDDTFTLREVLNYPYCDERSNIIKEYVKLIYHLHENGIEFIDNSSGNFLVKKENNGYNIYLVDLNRMNFYNKIKITKRLNNLSRISSDEQIIKIVSTEYSRLSSLPVDFCSSKIFFYSRVRKNKRELKNKLKLYLFLK